MSLRIQAHTQVTRSHFEILWITWEVRMDGCQSGQTCPGSSISLIKRWRVGIVASDRQGYGEILQFKNLGRILYLLTMLNVHGWLGHQQPKASAGKPRHLGSWVRWSSIVGALPPSPWNHGRHDEEPLSNTCRAGTGWLMGDHIEDLVPHVHSFWARMTKQTRSMQNEKSD